MSGLGKISESGVAVVGDAEMQAVSNANEAGHKAIKRLSVAAVATLILGVAAYFFLITNMRDNDFQAEATQETLTLSESYIDSPEFDIDNCLNYNPEAQCVEMFNQKLNEDTITVAGNM